MQPKCYTMTMDERKERVQELVDRFTREKEKYTSKAFNEANTRLNFIDPFLECLGWDVKNEEGKIEERKNVKVETNQLQGDSLKHPDYELRLGGQTVLYVEAKQPSVNIKDDISPAYQVRRYGYTSKLKLSLLTDFEELCVYDTSVKPLATDKASVARIEYYSYTQYVEKFEELYQKYSFKACDLGQMDLFAESSSKKGTATVDNDFLAMIEEWRMDLANDIALHNQTIDEYDLTGVVQKIIDRIIFLRICEDKQIEKYGSLQSIATANDSKKIATENSFALPEWLLKKDIGVYERLKMYFKDINNRYNSGLFENDEFINAINLSDKVLLKMIKQLYLPECPYVFYILPVEILGTVYERFLGKTIKFNRKTKNGHNITVEEKPEVQKAGGVYYTPRYIVDYIVTQTIGAKIQGKKPEQISKMRFVDPACGSGSFLVGAYDYLLRYHLDYYCNEKNKAKAEKNGIIYKDARTKEYKLTVEQKRQILVNNIYGVDLDIQATEVTKLSLFLKLLEDEGTSSAELFQASMGSTKKLLPDMKSNIKCGNSLVGTDFVNQGLFESKEEFVKVHPFDWNKEFGGMFDCVIGNPPYVNINTMPEFHEYFRTHYSEIHTGYNDLMYYFLYKGISLLKDDGFYGVITSNYFVGNDYAKKLRSFLNNHITCLVNFGKTLIFDNANVHTTLVFAQKNPKEDKIDYFKRNENTKIDEVDLAQKYSKIEMNRKELTEDWLIANSNDNKIIEKLKQNSVLLGDICDIEKGSTSGKNSIFTVSKDFANKNEFESELIRKNVKNSDILRYYKKDRGNVLIYTDNKTDINKYPKIKEYLSTHKKELSARNEVSKGLYEWYRFERPRNKAIFDAKEKLIVPYRAQHNRFAYDNEQYFNDGGDIRALVIKENCNFNIKYVLGLLNSTLLDWFYGFIGKSKGDMREYFNKPLAEIPICNASPDAQQNLATLVDQMLQTQAKLNGETLKQVQGDASCAKPLSPSDKQFLEQKVAMLDAQINTQVYALYGLTQEEIAVVEGR